MCFIKMNLTRGERLKKDSEKDEKNSIANFLQASSK
jgi:hypothetical protein